MNKDALADSTRQRILNESRKLGISHELLTRRYVFERFLARREAHLEAAAPRPRIRAWIVDRNLVLDRVEVSPSELLDQMKLVGVRRAGLIHPGALVESHRIDDERVALPVTD